MVQTNFFAEDARLSRLSAMGDPLEKVSSTVDFEQFRPLLNTALPKPAPAAPGGRPPWDTLLLFKILLLKQWYNLGDDMTEYIINDRLSFQRFLGIGLGDKVPDAKTIWLFNEKLRASGAAQVLLDEFARRLESRGVITRGGSIIDATFVEAPRQRNSREENRIIKEGSGDTLWRDEPHKRARKDTDARWTKKNNETHYGYKNHVKIDKKTKLIIRHTLTHAAVHDSAEAPALVDSRDKRLWADSAYTGKALRKALHEKVPGIRLHIHRKGARNRPLTDAQIAANRVKSKVRARVEHVFGHMTNSFSGFCVRCVGIGRARCRVALLNLAYNLQRYSFLARSGKIPKRALCGIAP